MTKLNGKKGSCSRNLKPLPHDWIKLDSFIFLITIKTITFKLLVYFLHILLTCWVIIMLLNSFRHNAIAPSVFLCYFFTRNFYCLSLNIFSIFSWYWASTKKPILLGTTCEPATSKPCTILAHLYLFLLQRYSTFSGIRTKPGGISKSGGT